MPELGPDSKTIHAIDTDMVSAEAIVAARPFELVEGMVSTPAMEKVFAAMRNDLVENIMLSHPEYNPLHSPELHVAPDDKDEGQLRDYQESLGMFGIPDHVIVAQYQSDLEDIICRLDTLVIKGGDAVERLPHASVTRDDTHAAIALLKNISTAEPGLLQGHGERIRMNDAIELLQAIEQRIVRPDDDIPPRYRSNGNPSPYR